MVKPRLFYGKTTYGLPMDSYGFYHGFPVKNHGFPMDSYGKTWFSGEHLPKTVPKTVRSELTGCTSASLRPPLVPPWRWDLFCCFIIIYTVFFMVYNIYIIIYIYSFCSMFDVLLFKTINWSYLFHSCLLNWHIERDIEHFWTNRGYACVYIYIYIYIHIYIYPNWCSGLKRLVHDDGHLSHMRKYTYNNLRHGSTCHSTCFLYHRIINNYP